ncbi:MAG: plastocyanin/azurin family copper-binding protein [Actinomycetota bacterium]
MNHGATFSFGEPADASDADRTIEVAQLDTPGFDPAAIDVEVGETVTFEVTNAGRTVHEFVLGDAAMQDQHEGAMGDAAGSMMADEVNAVSLSPSEKKSLTWTFTEPGTVLYGCHVDGHYAGGMVGQIRVGNG